MENRKTGRFNLKYTEKKETGKFDVHWKNWKIVSKTKRIEVAKNKKKNRNSKEFYFCFIISCNFHVTFIKIIYK